MPFIQSNLQKGFIGFIEQHILIQVQRPGSKNITLEICLGGVCLVLSRYNTSQDLYSLANITIYFLLVFFQGRSYCVRTQRMLNQCLESLVQKVLSGVVINFEKTGPDPPPVCEGMHPGIDTVCCSYNGKKWTWIIGFFSQHNLFMIPVWYTREKEELGLKSGVMTKLISTATLLKHLLVALFDMTLKNVSKNLELVWSDSLQLFFFLPCRWSGGSSTTSVILQFPTLAQLPQAHICSTQP